MLRFEWTDLLNNLLQIGLTVSAAALVLFLLRKTLKKRYPARAMCIVWAVLALRLLIPVQLTLPDPPVQVTPVKYVSLQTSARTGAAPAASDEADFSPVAEQTDSTVQDQTQDAPARVTADAENASWDDSLTSDTLVPVAKILFVLWGAGMLAFAIWQIYGYVSFCYLVRQTGESAQRDTLRAVFEEQKRALGIRRDIPLRVTRAADCPMLAGFVSPTLYLPDEALSAEDAAFIFRHELTHYKRGDLWLKLALVAARAVHWFNPLVHLLARFAQEDIELACDDAVVRGMDVAARRAYGETILRSVEAQVKRRALVSCFTGDKKTLMRRFEGLFDKKAKKRGIALVVAAAVLVGTLGCTFSVGESKKKLTEEDRVALAQQWAQQTENLGYAVKLDGEDTYVLYDVQFDNLPDEVVPYRTGEKLVFERGADGWQVAKAEPVAPDGVTSLDEFRILYENDLGLPDPLEVGKDSFTQLDPDTWGDPTEAAVYLLHLKTIGTSGGSSLDRTMGDDIMDLTVGFADGSEVTLTMVNQFGDGWLPQDFTYDGGKNNRTAADLAGQYARGVTHKSGQYIYPILTAQKQQDYRTAQQLPDGGFSWKYGGSSPSYRNYTLVPTSGGEYIAVFQMYGGGVDDTRSAYLVTTARADGRRVINSVTEVAASNYTKSDLFKLYYDSGLPWPTVSEGAQSFNGASLDTLTRVQDAVETVFGYFGENVEHIEGNQHQITTERWFTSEVVSEDESEATVRLNFVDNSPSVDVQMRKTGDYWLPVGLVTQFDEGFGAYLVEGDSPVSYVQLPVGATIQQAIENANGEIPLLEAGQTIKLEPLYGKLTATDAVLTDAVIHADGTLQYTDKETQQTNIRFTDVYDRGSAVYLYKVEHLAAEALSSTPTAVVYRGVTVTYRTSAYTGTEQEYTAAFVYRLSNEGVPNTDYTIHSTEYHNATYGYTLTLPDCFVEQGYAVESDGIVQFGLQNALPGYSDDPTDGGGVMTLQVEATAYLRELYGEDWQAEYVIPCKELAERDGLTWYLAFASDVQYDPTDEEITAAYTEMYQAAQALGAEALSFDGQTAEQRTNEQALLLRALARVYAAQNDSTAELIRDEVTIQPEVADNAALVVIRFVVPTRDYFFTTVERVWYDRTDTTTPSRTEALVNTSDGVRSLEEFWYAFPLEQGFPVFDTTGLESLSEMAAKPASLENPDLSSPEACAEYVLHFVGGKWVGKTGSEDDTEMGLTYRWDDGEMTIRVQRVQLTDSSPVLWLPFGYDGSIPQYPPYLRVVANMMEYYPYRTTVELLQALEMGWVDGAYAEAVFAELDKRWQQDEDAVEDAVAGFGAEVQTMWQQHKTANPDIFGARFSDEEIEAAYAAVRSYARWHGFSVENLHYDASHDFSFSQGIMKGGVLQDNVLYDGLTIDNVITVMGDAQFSEDAWREQAEGWSFTLYRGADGKWVLENGAYGY
ncbi:M56 family metallopeptidase [Agathobaculum sp. Marseille-P7918]|uniref:M56 family metallopeptidase n=1 Tax=Agathobaculum sp. Marseille-P7918 TaxID=2479843 RepID=UPI000F63E848|nr:M56 family metallopeptidase [Agathobaculum sp. Marseille-P7918]